MTGQPQAAKPRRPDFTGILIATPTYGDVHHEFARELFNAARLMQSFNLPFDLAFKVDSLLQRSRAELAASFLDRTNFSHLLFIDSDIEFPAQAIPALLGCDKDVIAGLYRKKRSDPTAIEWACNWKVIDNQHRIDPDTGAVEILDAGTGFMMIKRSALLKMREAYPELRYRVRDAKDGQPAQYAHDFFALMLEQWSDGEKVLISEDYAFCRRWRAIGGQIWALPGLPLTHHGRWEWKADCVKWLKGEEQAGYSHDPTAIRNRAEAEQAQRAERENAMPRAERENQLPAARKDSDAA